MLQNYIVHLVTVVYSITENRTVCEKCNGFLLPNKNTVAVSEENSQIIQHPAASFLWRRRGQGVYTQTNSGFKTLSVTKTKLKIASDIGNKKGVKAISQKHFYVLLLHC